LGLFFEMNHRDRGGAGEIDIQFAYRSIRDTNILFSANSAVWAVNLEIGFVFTIRTADMRIFDMVFEGFCEFL